MTLRGLPILVCLLLALGICTSAHAWMTHHGSDICAGGGSSGAAAGGAIGSNSAGSAGGAASTGVGGAGAAIGGVGNGGGVDAGGDPSGAALQGAAPPYSLRAIYFRRDQFRSTGDCLTAANTQRLPLEVCQ
jgi:hypothetical protein